MNFEDIMLSETSQPQKDKYCMSPLTRGTKLVKFIAIESWLSPARERGKENGNSRLPDSLCSFMDGDTI